MIGWRRETWWKERLVGVMFTAHCVLKLKLALSLSASATLLAECGTHFCKVSTMFGQVVFLSSFPICTYLCRIILPPRLNVQEEAESPQRGEGRHRFVFLGARATRCAH